MLRLRGLDTVRVTKVKGHADEDMVLDGRVREVDRLGNNAADEAADSMQSSMLVGICLRYVGVGILFFLIFIGFSLPFLELWSTMHDGRDGTAPDPLVLFAGALPKRRRLVHAVRDRAFLPGPLGIWDSEWVCILASAICAEDIAHWPYTPGLLVEWVSILGSLHWPAGGLDLRVGGISYVELLILFELGAGERLSLEKAHPRYLRPGRPISVSAVPFGPGIDIWRSCRFIGAMLRSLCLLPGGLGLLCLALVVLITVGFVIWVGRGVVMVLLLGLGKVPLSLFSNELLSLFGDLPGSARALLAGTPPLRYCAARFASRTPTWRLPVPGHVAGLITAGSGVVPEVIASDVGHGGSLGSWFWSGTEKNST